MTSDTYPARVLSLRKTKLGETDLILTLLAENGTQLRAVAKGARKPASSFASRLDVFCEADVLLVTGKNLDIVKEARLTNPHRGVRENMEHAAAASPVVDLMERISQPGLESPKLYPLTSSVLTNMENASTDVALALCAAHLLKAFAYAGFKPSFDRCVVCGAPVNLLDAASPSAYVSCSPAEGGVVCNKCLPFSEARRISGDVLAYANHLLYATFAEIGESQESRRLTFEVLHLCQAWVQEHVGSRLKSLDFLFSSGIF